MFIKPLTDKLKRTGLEEKEALVYAYLVESGGAFPSDIATKTKLNRSTVYKILATLSIRGIIAEVEKKKKLFYYPETPSKFLRSMKSKITLAEDSYEKAVELIPELEGLYKNSDGRPRVTFYEGKEQVIAAYMKQVEGKDKYELLAFANTDRLQSFLPARTFREYIKLKEKYGIMARGIIPDTPAARQFSKKTHWGVKKSNIPETRYVPLALFPFAGEIVMYGKNKILMVKFDEHAPIAVIIEDTMIHNMMCMIFELAWGQTKR